MSKLVILHLDGVSADALGRALDSGHMPHLRRLIDAEGYEIHRYRCGLPSTTPFAQAGILYGDNSEIPSFRWWDRERRVLVKFGPGSTFDKVADKYFKGCRALTRDGACIAACYPGEAADDFGIAYQARSYGRQPKSRSAANVLVPYLANPIHLGDWVWQTAAVFARTARDFSAARSEGRHPAAPYVATDLAEEIFVHHLTRYAVIKAMTSTTRSRRWPRPAAPVTRWSCSQTMARSRQLHSAPLTASTSARFWRRCYPAFASARASAAGTARTRTRRRVRS
ncbi:MAG: hypothetical protein E6I04_02880 [Chloroflexi bacterium]|nr:MAG: hypothetical protein E6I04_02880 [Chloroflexota bacterium]